MVPPDQWDHHDINVKPTLRRGWWLMVLFMWDAVFHPAPSFPHKREDEIHRGD